MPSPSYSARKTAWIVLNRCDITQHDTAELLNKYLPKTDRPAQATDIAFGVIRNRLAIDTVIKRSGNIEPARVKPALWNLLRLGTYELVYAAKTAEYAILNEVGNLARQKGSERTVGFVNAVLRAVQTNILSRQAPLQQGSPRTIIPQNEKTGCSFKIDILPDPEKDPVNYYSAAFSLPTWLISQWLAVYGDSTTRQICQASNRTPSLVAQPNVLYTAPEKLAARLAEEGIECELNHEKSMLCIKHTGQITKIRAFLDGLFMIRDPTAAEPVKLLNPQPGWTVADLCAAPGGKTVALTMLMADNGMILASDSDTVRLQKVRQNVKRMRLNAIEVVVYPEIEKKIQKLKKLDAIVLDVPCSNTGVLARRVEARWRLQKKSIDELLQAQNQLLTNAAALCQHNTRILYSTCSIQPEENQHQIQNFLSQQPVFTLEKEKLTLPALKTKKLFDHDGGYVAVLARK